MLLFVVLLIGCTMNVSAFFAFDRVDIDQQELASDTVCDIVICQNIIAYKCAASLKVFLNNKDGAEQTSKQLYSTTKAVAQVRPSKLADEPFISFIEARVEEDLEPAPYAFLRVVGPEGLRDLGITNTFIPNRSIYLGSNLALRINQAQTNLQAFDLTTKEKSTFINILNSELAYDMRPVSSLSQSWVISACQKDKQSQNCNFYALRGTQLIPYAQNTVSESCEKTITLSQDYLMLECHTLNTVSLYTFSSSYVMSRVLYLTNIEQNDASLLTYSSQLSLLIYTKAYAWTLGQTKPLNFIDSVVLIKKEGSSRPIMVNFEKEYFYEGHAYAEGASSYIEHIIGWHGASLLGSYGNIVRFSVSDPYYLTIIAQNESISDGQVAYSLHSTKYCGLNAIRLPSSSSAVVNSVGCYQPEATEFIDWTKMQSNGLVQTTLCNTSANQMNTIQQVMRASSCSGYSLNSLQDTSSVMTLYKKHLELDPVQCSTGKKAIGGHCVSCGSLCQECLFPNTGGLVHWFYLNGIEAQGTCQTCAALSQVDTNTGQCTCQSTYYLDQTSDSCKKCSQNCVKCSSFDQCETCEDNFVVTSNGSCREVNCPDGFYLDQQSEQCISCHQSCETCSSDGSKCLTCPSGFLLGDTICVQCEQRETIQGDTCVKCNDACLECSDQNSCTLCQEGATLANGECKCDDGYYMDASFSICLKCDATCATCEDFSTCKTCPAGLALGETKCLQCGSDEFLDKDNCVKCGVNCLECSAGPNQCNLCQPGSTLQADGTCSCDKGRYFDQSLGACVQCHGSCETCVEADKCETCPAGYTHGDSICLSCDSNEYVDGNECKKCSPGCLSCEPSALFGSICRQCVSNSGLQQDGTCECLTGFYQNQELNECSQCDSSCLTCDKSGSCLTCKPGQIIGASGLCECPAGSALGDTKCISCQSNEFIKGDTCTSCGFQCDYCDTGPNQCQKCSNTSKLEFGACFCDIGTFRNLELQDAYGECTACHQSCSSCEDATSCTECLPGYSFGSSVCLKCESDEYLKGDSCIKCGTNCLECDFGPNMCKKCAPGTQLQADTGICVCEAGRYFDEVIQACVMCHSSCETCSGPDKCSTCPPGQILGNSICLNCAADEYVFENQCKSCGVNCKKCSANPQTGGSLCQECASDNNIQLDGTCACFDGFYYNDSDKKCLQCDSNCLTCENQASQCKTCQSGFELTAQKTCSEPQVDLVCKSNQFIQDGVCSNCDSDCLTCSAKGSCESCLSPAILGDKRCLDCPAETLILNDQCTRCDSLISHCSQCQKSNLGELVCNECQAGFKILDSKCVCINESDYFDEVAGVCNACPSNCASCINESQCTACVSKLETVGSDGQCHLKQCANVGFLDEVTSSCQTCDTNCATCESKSTYCTSCPNPQIQILSKIDNTCISCDLGVDPFLQSACICKQGEFFDLQNKKCSQCNSANCLACGADGQECLSCWTNFDLNKQTGNCDCPQLGFYQDSSSPAQCLPCSDGCLSCLEDNGTCDNCLPGFFLKDSTEFLSSNSQSTSCIACLKGCAECSDIQTCNKCENTFKLSQDGVCRCPRGTFYELAIDACIACTLENCDNCLDRDICIDCIPGYESIFSGKVCKEILDVDVQYEPQTQANEAVTSQAKPIDENSVMYKTLAISVGTLIILIILCTVCFLSFKAYKKKQRRKKRVEDMLRTTRVTLEDGSSFNMDQEELQQRIGELLNSHRSKKEAPQAEDQTQSPDSISPVHKNRRQNTVPPIMIRNIHERQPFQPEEQNTIELDQAREQNVVTDYDQNNRTVDDHGHFKFDTIGTPNQQHRFTSSPKRQRESDQPEQEDKDNLITIAQQIMDDCEIEINEEQKKQMDLLTNETTAYNHTHVLEQIIRIMAHTVKDQIESVHTSYRRQQTNQETELAQAIPSPNSLITQGSHKLKQRIRSAAAQRALSRYVGTPQMGAKRSSAVDAPPVGDILQIERNIAERFDELSRCSGINAEAHNVTKSKANSDQASQNQNKIVPQNHNEPLNMINNDNQLQRASPKSIDKNSQNRHNICPIRNKEEEKFHIHNSKNSSSMSFIASLSSSVLGMKSRISAPSIQVVAEKNDDIVGNGLMKDKSRSFLETQQINMMNPLQDEEIELDKDKSDKFLYETKIDAPSKLNQTSAECIIQEAQQIINESKEEYKSRVSTPFQLLVDEDLLSSKKPASQIQDEEIYKTFESKPSSQKEETKIKESKPTSPNEEIKNKDDTESVEVAQQQALSARKVYSKADEQALIPNYTFDPKDFNTHRASVITQQPNLSNATDINLSRGITTAVQLIAAQINEIQRPHFMSCEDGVNLDGSGSMVMQENDYVNQISRNMEISQDESSEKLQSYSRNEDFKSNLSLSRRYDSPSRYDQKSETDRSQMKPKQQFKGTKWMGNSHYNSSKFRKTSLPEKINLPYRVSNGQIQINGNCQLANQIKEQNTERRSTQPTKVIANLSKANSMLARSKAQQNEFLQQPINLVDMKREEIYGTDSRSNVNNSQEIARSQGQNFQGRKIKSISKEAGITKPHFRNSLSSIQTAAKQSISTLGGATGRMTKVTVQDSIEEEPIEKRLFLSNALSQPKKQYYWQYNNESQTSKPDKSMTSPKEKGKKKPKRK